MTWSIVAHDPKTGAFAVAVATRAFAGWAPRRPFVRAGVGAVSALRRATNRRGLLAPQCSDGPGPRCGRRRPGRRDRGCSRRRCRQRPAPGARRRSPRPHRRVDPAATASNGAAVPPCRAISVAGNMLAGEQVVAATLAAADRQHRCPARTPDGPSWKLARRQAAIAAASSPPPCCSAPRKISPTSNLRVDGDHQVPCCELRRLVEIWRSEAEPRLANAPSRSNPSGFTDLEAIERRLGPARPEPALPPLTTRGDPNRDEGRPCRRRSPGTQCRPSQPHVDPPHRNLCTRSVNRRHAAAHPGPRRRHASSRIALNLSLTGARTQDSAQRIKNAVMMAFDERRPARLRLPPRRPAAR